MNLNQYFEAGNTTEEVTAISLEEKLDATMALSDYNDALEDLQDKMFAMTGLESLEKMVGCNINADKARLENKDGLTAGVVCASLEAFANVVDGFGVKVAATPSLESIDSNPAGALSISLEEKESLFRKIVNAIVEMMKTVWVSIKKMYAKGLVFLNNSKKDADALAKELKDVKEFELKEETQKSLAERFGVLAALNNRKLDGKVITNFGNAVLDGLKGKEHKDVISNASFTTVSPAGQFDKLKGSDLEKSFDGVDKDSMYTLIGVSGSTAKFITKKGEAEPTISTLTLKPDVVKDVKIAIGTVKEATDVVTIAGKIGDELKKAIATAEKASEDIKKKSEGYVKDIEALEKKDSLTEPDKVQLEDLKNKIKANKIAARFTLESTIEAVKSSMTFNKNALAVGRAIVKSKK